MKSPHTPYSLLVVDDEESIRRLLQKELSTSRRRVPVAASAGEALAMCRRESFDVILLDIRLRDGNGLDLLPQFRSCLPDAAIIMITGHADVAGAVTAMRNGAYDFVPKPFHLDQLEMLVDRAFEHTRLARENRSLRLSFEDGLIRLVGGSPAMRRLLYLLEKVAPTEVPVLITGESGTGKSVAAAAIHRVSARAGRPFVVKNCAGLQKELARSELFGHVKGAFTNALESSEGLMTVAGRGTLFLDEVGELPLEVQGQLLRVLESGRYRRVGEKEERHTDVRFVFATNRDLQREVRAGNFHEALFHRINVFPVVMPALRDRPEDIPPLAEHFLLSVGKGNAAIAPEAARLLMRYSWPGNVRELRNVIERGLILAENGLITERSLPPELTGRRPESDSGTLSGLSGPALGPATEAANRADPVDSAGRDPLPAGFPAAASSLRLEDVERAHIAHVLALHGGNKRRAAEVLGIGRRTLYRKLNLSDDPDGRTEPETPSSPSAGKKIF